MESIFLFPETKEKARSKNDNYLTFSVMGKNESDFDVFYEIKVLNSKSWNDFDFDDYYL